MTVSWEVCQCVWCVRCVSGCEEHRTYGFLGSVVGAGGELDSGAAGRALHLGLQALHGAAVDVVERDPVGGLQLGLEVLGHLVALGSEAMLAKPRGVRTPLAQSQRQDFALY